jgi:hypothetical protein
MASGKRPDITSPGAGNVSAARHGANLPQAVGSMSATSPGPSSTSDIFDPHALFGLPQTNFSNMQSARSTSILGLPPTQDDAASPPSFDAMFDSIVGNIPGGGLGDNTAAHTFSSDGMMPPDAADVSQSAFFGLPLSADPSADDWWVERAHPVPVGISWPS